MRITQWGEYGVLFSGYLAKRARDGAATVGAAEIAQALGVDIQYAQQILQRLRRGAVVDSVRGPSGGYKLARPASEITLHDVIVASEGDTLEVICDVRPLKDERCNSNNPCGLRTLWNDLKEHVNSFLKKYSLEEISQMPMHFFDNVQGASGFAGHKEMPVQLGGRLASVSERIKAE